MRKRKNVPLCRILIKINTNSTSHCYTYICSKTHSGARTSPTPIHSCYILHTSNKSQIPIINFQHPTCTSGKFSSAQVIHTRSLSKKKQASLYHISSSYQPQPTSSSSSHSSQMTFLLNRSQNSSHHTHDPLCYTYINLREISAAPLAQTITARHVPPPAGRTARASGVMMSSRGWSIT